MGLLSLFKLRKRANSSAHAHQRVALRESPGDSEQRLRQRARWRLLGACLLVAISVAFLPELLDVASQPVTAVADIKIRQQRTDSSTAVAEHSSSLSTPRSSISLSSTKSAEMALSEGEEVVPQHSTKAITQESLATRNNAVPASQINPVTAKFFLKAGAFASEARAYNWLAKLKAAKLSAHIHHKKMAEGERYLVRVGPFTDHESAQAAQKKLQNMGLPSIITEGTQL